MRPSELRLLDLVRADGGAMRFGGARAVIFDAVALGSLRKELIELVGLATARGILTRLGYAHGVRMAEAAQRDFDWDDPRDVQRAGTHFAQLVGFADISPAAEAGHPAATWHRSYEAEQHLLHLGRADAPVCWTLCGYASGWVSYVRRRDVFFLEDRCAGRGDATCHVVGRSPDAWGPERAEEIAYFQKEALDESVRRLGSRLREIENKLRRRRRELSEEGNDGGLVVRSGKMTRILETARRAAGVDATILVTGESGTGKERVARYVHEHSTRANGPFVAINCGALTETLLESELFGHCKGAFTGAQQERAGLFEAAHRGTLFLDEIGDVSPAMQVKLLRAIQEREVRRVGENQSRPVDVRILAATNRDLPEDISAGRFREDLYYRLKVVEIAVPPLRERREDIVPLARAFCLEASERMRRRVGSIHPAAADALRRYRWPGNVRELQNAIEGAVALATGEDLRAEDLPQEVRSTSVAPRRADEVRTLETVEREYVLAVLARNGGNRTRTARQLGIGSATLYRMLKRWTL